MAIAFNPSIPRSGLICYLDAANLASYNPSENLLLQSEAVSTSPWTQWIGNGGSTITTNAIAGPTGTVTADLVAQAGNDNSILQQVTVGGQVPLTASIYIKTVTANSLRFSLWRSTGGTSEHHFVTFNPASGILSAPSGPIGTSARVEPLNNGWYRIQLTTIGTQATNTVAQLELYNLTTGASSYYVWGAQIERSMGATPYTATTTSQVTRGTTWTDLSGSGNNGTLNNFPAYKVNPNGFKFNTYVSNQSITVPTLDLRTQPFTIVGVGRYDGLGALGRVFGSTSNNWLMGQWNGSTANYYSEGWVTNVGNGGYDTNWGVHVVTGYSVTDYWQYYKNGVFVAANNGGGNGPWIPQLGAGTGEPASCEVSAYLIYNRILSPAEISQVSAALTRK